MRMMSNDERKRWSLYIRFVCDEDKRLRKDQSVADCEGKREREETTRLSVFYGRSL